MKPRNSNLASEASAQRMIPKSSIQPFGYTGVPPLVADLWGTLASSFDSFIQGTEAFLKRQPHMNVSEEDIHAMFDYFILRCRTVKSSRIRVSKSFMRANTFKITIFMNLIDNSEIAMKGIIKP